MLLAAATAVAATGAARRLINEYIEKHVCPTTTSDSVLGGRPFEFAGQVKRTHTCADSWTVIPHCVNA